MSWQSQVLLSLGGLVVAVAVLFAIARYLPGMPAQLQVVVERATHAHNIDRRAVEPR